MLKRLILFIIFTIFIFSGCSSTPASYSLRGDRNQPEWVLDINSVYPSNQYIAVLGEGDSLSKAQAKAAANMALIFESRIKVDTTVETRYADMKKQGVLISTSEETLVGDNISQSSDQTLFNLKFGESWTDSMGTVIVAAYLNRMETANLYRVRMEEQSKILVRLKKLGDDSRNIMEKYAYYDSSYVIALNNEMMKEQLDIISPAAASIAFTDYEIADIKSARKSAADQMIFHLYFTGANQTILNSAVSAKLTNMGFSVSDRGDILVTGSLNSEKIIRNNDYQNYKWYLFLEVVDETAKTILTIDESGISVSTSESAAKSRINTDVEKVINKGFTKGFNTYLNSFLDK